MGQQCRQIQWEEFVGDQHERTAAWSAVGIGFQRGTTSAGDGARNENAAERERGERKIIETGYRGHCIFHTDANRYAQLLTQPGGQTGAKPAL